jgi:hypothetical protein
VGTSTWTCWNTSDTSTCSSYGTSDDAWVSWTTTSGTTASSETNNEVWYYWTSDSTTDCTVRIVDSAGAWDKWNSDTYRVTYGDYSTPVVDQRRERVKRKRAQRRAERGTRKFKAREAMRLIEIKKAEEKAQELLLDLIGPVDMAIYKRTGRVFVKGREFDWLLQTEGNRCRLQKVTKDKIHDLCIHMSDYKMPKTDQVVGFLLNAKFNEKHLDKTANLVRVNEKWDGFEKHIREAASA